LLTPATGERLICRARVIKPGRQIAVVAADVFCMTDGTRNTQRRRRRRSRLSELNAPKIASPA